jgi:hypothetical protein
MALHRAITAVQQKLGLTGVQRRELDRWIPGPDPFSRARSELAPEIDWRAIKRIAEFVEKGGFEIA